MHRVDHACSEYRSHDVARQRNEIVRSDCIHFIIGAIQAPTCKSPLFNGVFSTWFIPCIQSFTNVSNDTIFVSFAASSIRRCLLERGLLATVGHARVGYNDISKTIEYRNQYAVLGSNGISIVGLVKGSSSSCWTLEAERSRSQRPGSELC